MNAKKLCALLLTLVMILALCACGAEDTSASEAPAGNAAEPATTEEKSFEIKLAGIKNDEDSASIAMQVFADEVNSNSDTLTVKVYTNSVLGGLNDLLSGMTNGTVDMMYNTLTSYPWVKGAEAFNVVAAPFLWDDNAELEAFLQTEEAEEWFESAAQTSGVRCVIAAGELSPRELTANVPVENDEDFKGLKNPHSRIRHRAGDYEEAGCPAYSYSFRRSVHGSTAGYCGCSGKRLGHRLQLQPL